MIVGDKMGNQSLYRQIYSKFQLGPASHMTHIENVESILRANKLFSYNQIPKERYQCIANDDVQKARSNKIITETQRTIHDYVPLYFGNRTPMVACNQNQNEDLVFLRFSLNLLEIEGVVITNGNARSVSTQFKLYSQLSDLSFLEPKIINSPKYKEDAERKRRKQAEILVPDALPLVYLIDFICYTNAKKQRLFEIFERCGKKYPIQVLPGSWYFKNQSVPK
jgi:hypothetical protein